MFDDISFLVQETLDDAEKAKPNKNLFTQFFSEHLSFKNDDLPCEGPGVLYHLQLKANTFVIRIYPCENLLVDYKSVLKHPDLYPSLRTHESDKTTKETLQFFECDNFEIAKNIKTQLGNKRFPLFEEHIFNVSDPCDSWWLRTENDKFTVLFQLAHTDNIQDLIKLGPLGETEKYKDLFSKLFGYFKMIFPVGEYSSSLGQFRIGSSEPHHFYFNQIKNILINGEISTELWEYMRQMELNASSEEYRDSIQKANYVLMELAMMRNFWKTIQEQL